MISLGTPHGTIASFNVRGSMDRVTLHELVRSEQVGVFLRAYPAWVPLLEPFQIEYEAFLAPIEEYYQGIVTLSDADFAHAARSRWYHFVLFGARR